MSAIFSSVNQSTTAGANPASVTAMKASFRKLGDQIKGQVKERAEQDQRTIDSILDFAGSENFYSAFNYLVTMKHVEKFENKFHLLEQLLNHIHHNYPENYMKALQTAVNTVVKHSQSSIMSPFLKTFMAQQTNINHADQKLYYGLMIELAVVCHNIAISSAENLAQSKTLVSNYANHFRTDINRLAEKPAGKVNQMLALSDDELYYADTRKLPLHVLYSDAVASKPLIFQFLLYKIAAEYPTDVRDSEVIVREFLIRYYAFKVRQPFTSDSMVDDLVKIWARSEPTSQAQAFATAATAISTATAARSATTSASQAKGSAETAAMPVAAQPIVPMATSAVANAPALSISVENSATAAASTIAVMAPDAAAVAANTNVNELETEANSKYGVFL